MKFGDYDCYPIDLGDFAVDGGAMFGIVPKTEWERKIPADEKNRIPLKSRALLVQGNGKNILVDTGCGTKLTADQKETYGIDKDPMDLNLLLSGYDIDCHQITDVVLTHLHFDHAGGSTHLENGRAVPVFPNATYYVQSEQWEEACNPHERDRESYLPDDFQPLQEYGNLRLLDGSLELFEGLDIMVTYGHTKAQQHLVVKGVDQSLFHCADLVPTAAHIPVHWIMGYDGRPLDLFPEKDYFLRKAIRDNWILFFEHDPTITAATLKQGEKWMEFDTEVKM
ncbi:MAG: MBL fold metallo-hydrolase [Proteobacteria bacterium]|nr:MBL fold metallo-hydrolase [Pseudomonadota bacterium]